MLSNAKWTFYTLAACTVIFFFEPLLPMDQLMFTPAYAFSRPWTFVTAMFLHANFAHLFFNMLALFFFGIYLEPRIGGNRFLFAYFSAGLLGNLGFWLFNPTSMIPALGASGAIYGILGVLAVLEPTLIIYVDFIPMPMVVAAVLWLLTSLVGIFGPPTGIGYQAHLVGLLFGFGYGFYLRKSREERRTYGYRYTYGW